MSLSIMRIGWRNLGRNRTRTLLAVGAVALGQFTLVFVNSVMVGFFHDMIDTVTGPMVGHVKIQHPTWREEQATDCYLDNLDTLHGAVSALPAVERAAPRIYAPVMAASGEHSDVPAEAAAAMIVGVDVALEQQRGGLLAHLAPRQIPEGREVSLGDVLARRLGVSSGQMVAIIGQDIDGFPMSELFRVKSVMDSTVDMMKTMGVIMPLAQAGELVAMPNQAHEMIVHGGDAHDVAALKRDIAALPHLDGLELLTWREAAPEIMRMLDVKRYFDFIFLAIVFVAVAVGIANTAMLSTFDRKHEFGMLLALGTRPRRVVDMILVESVILGLVGVLLGSALGALVVLITSRTGLDFAAFSGSDVETMAFKNMSVSFVVYPRIQLAYFLVGVCAVMVTAILASLWPASLAARFEPMEAMRT